MIEKSVLFVCLGNICRSPVAEAVFRKKVHEAGLGEVINVDSASTSGWHDGDLPDRRMREAASVRGYDLSTIISRQVQTDDYHRFDLILAMDEQNLTTLLHHALPGHEHKISLFLDFAPQQTEQEVPDPYYGGADGFFHVIDLIEDASDGLLLHLQKDLTDN